MQQGKETFTVCNYFLASTSYRFFFLIVANLTQFLRFGKEFPCLHINAKVHSKILTSLQLNQGQHGILIFSCFLFVLFEKRNPDIFVWSLSLCYTVVGLGIYCPKYFAFKKFKAEIVYFIIKKITNTHKKFFAKLWKLTNICLNFTSKCFLSNKKRTLQNFLFGQ